MLSWAEVKEAIRECLGPTLVELGFTNPGKTMWRYRPVFIDVVDFYHVGHAGRFIVEFGCHPRRGAAMNLKPPECFFRTFLPDASGTRLPEEVYELAVSREEQHERLERIKPVLVAGVQRWFAKFESLESAAEAMKHNDLRGPNMVMLARPGSPAYAEVEGRLLSLREEDAV
jgi:hypothetical protein